MKKTVREPKLMEIRRILPSVKNFPNGSTAVPGISTIVVKAKKQKHGRQGEGGGKPPKYSNGKDIWDKANEFFEICDTNKQMPEKAGLCLYLGISRDTYCQYRKRYPDAIKGIDMYIESCWVRRLNGQAATGAIFYLKNAFKEEYRDRYDTDITSGGLRLSFDPTFKK